MRIPQMKSLFKRRVPSAGGSSPITEFWDWWAASGEARFTAAVASGNYGDLPEQITAKVMAIHPDLQWDTRNGESSQHALCVTAAGVAALRPVAERWFRAAPAASETWEFVAARRRDAAVLKSTLDFSGVKLELAMARVGIFVDETRQSLDVKVFHPMFTEVGENASRQVTFLLLDWLVGEDDVERWLGEIQTVFVDPESSVPIESLYDVVVAMAERHGEAGWFVAESTTPTGKRLLVTARTPMRWIDYPLFDLHTGIRHPFSEQLDDGLPAPAALEKLAKYEDRLVDALGDRGLLVAAETFEGQRLFHVYTDSEDQNARDIIDTLVGGAEAAHSMDPSWQLVRRFA